MRIVFMGTPDFALAALKTLYAAQEEIIAVYTQPPRQRGRGKKLLPSPVQAFAEAHQLVVRHPHKLKGNEEEEHFLHQLAPDVIVVAAYGLLLPPEILSIPTYGALNIHASLLPRWRGASPIQQAIRAGDKKSGVTIMRMTTSLDAGDIYKQKDVPITQQTTASSLHDELAECGGPLLLDVLKTWPSPIPQNGDGVTYAPQLSKEDGLIDWSAPAQNIERQIRAFTPWPGSYTHTAEGTRLKIGQARVIQEQGQLAPPGTILDEHITVACGAGLLQLEKIQRPSKTMMKADDFLKGFSLPPQTILQ